MSLITMGDDTFVPTPSRWPSPMGHYGKNPYGEPLYRIVFASTVKMVVGGDFSDGFVGYRIRPAYRHIGDKWILEKWISGFEYTKMSEEVYNLEKRDPYTGLLITGPYPHSGVYFHCFTFDGAPNEHTSVDSLIELLNKANTNDPAKVRQAIIDHHAAKEAQDDAMRYDRVKDMMPAFGMRAANLGGHVKATKSAPILKSANELGLPVRGVTQIRENSHGRI